MPPNQAQVKDAIRIILSDRYNYPLPPNYAVNYCREALSMTGAALRVHCLYIVGRITHWRHPRANEIRSILRSFCNL